MSDLAAPDNPEDLWHARTPQEVASTRMLMQGDIIVLGSEPVCVVAHACSMRRGAQLHATQTVAPIRDHEVNDWTGNYDWMPLPGAPVPEIANPAANLRKLRNESTDSLQSANRIAVMSEIGVQLLQQRMAFHVTRVAIDLETLGEQTAPILMEANLHEEWTVDLGPEEETDFHSFLDADGRKLREWMKTPRTRYQAQMAIRKEIRRRLRSHAVRTSGRGFG